MRRKRGSIIALDHPLTAIRNTAPTVVSPYGCAVRVADVIESISGVMQRDDNGSHAIAPMVDNNRRGEDKDKP